MENKFIKNDELKTEIDAFRPLPHETLAQIKEYYKIGLTYSSNALEGNSLDLVETKVVLEDGITIGGRPVKDHLEALGHADAFNRLLELAQGETFSENDIKELHHLFYNKIDEGNAGKYRTRQVVVTGSQVEFPKPDELDEKMSNFAAQMLQMKKDLHPVEFAAMVHVVFVNIHPFIDGNGRVARLLMNLALLQAGYNITIIPPVMRSDYIRALQHSNKGVFEPFVDFIAEMVLESQKEYLKILKRLE